MSKDKASKSVKKALRKVKSGKTRPKTSHKKKK